MGLVANRMAWIYLDTNVYTRPFDDQTRSTIQEEANAFLEIITNVKSGTLQLLGSDILSFEVANILSEDKRTKVEAHLALCGQHVASSDEVLELGRQIQSTCHLRPRDALHVASAIIGGARYFLSCDNHVSEQKHAKCYRRLAKQYREEYFSAMSPTLFAEKLKKGKLA